MTTDRTTLRLSDERKRLLDQASEIVASDPSDDPPMSDVIDAALTQLIESHENLNNVRDRYPPQEVKNHHRARTTSDPRTKPCQRQR